MAHQIEYSGDRLIPWVLLRTLATSLFQHPQLDVLPDFKSEELTIFSMPH
jgi:hypothetical protein